jgi:hypothetical protein
MHTPFDPKPPLANALGPAVMVASDVVDDARSRHRSAHRVIVVDESHEGSRPDANYHDRF